MKFPFAPSEADIADYNRRIGRQIDDFRTFVNCHYVTEREDTPFWRHVRGQLHSSGDARALGRVAGPHATAEPTFQTTSAASRMPRRRSTIRCSMALAISTATSHGARWRQPEAPPAGGGDFRRGCGVNSHGWRARRSATANCSRRFPPGNEQTRPPGSAAAGPAAVAAFVLQRAGRWRRGGPLHCRGWLGFDWYKLLLSPILPVQCTLIGCQR